VCLIGNDVTAVGTAGVGLCVFIAVRCFDLSRSIMRVSLRGAMTRRAMPPVAYLLVGPPLPDRSEESTQTKRHPGLPAWGLGVWLATAPRKKFIAAKEKEGEVGGGEGGVGEEGGEGGGGEEGRGGEEEGGEEGRGGGEEVEEGGGEEEGRGGEEGE